MRSMTGTDSQRIEVLIAEDSPTQAEHLRYLLEENGCKVTVAKNGKAALAAAHERKPTLLISDIVMPEMDGYTLCKELKSHEKLRNIPVILLTSLATPIDIIRGLECGADNFIPKPYEPDYLLSHINHILANAEIRKGQKTQIGVEIIFSNEKFLITSERQQILDLLLSTYETAVQQNAQLTKIQNELKQLNEQLDQKVKARTAQLAAEITERTRAEEEIRKLNAELEKRVIHRTAELQATTSFLNNILDSATEYSIIATDLDGKILTWNEGARRRYGYSAEETVGKLNFRVLHPDDELASRKVDAFVESAFKVGKAEGEFEGVSRNGDRFPCSVAVTLRREADGQAMGYLMIFKDITRQRALEEQLHKSNLELEDQNRRIQQANQHKSEFLANMSHELRTPLNGIIGFAEIMHDEKVGPLSPEHKEYLGDILTSSKHLLQLINDVLDLSKVEAGKMDFELAPVDPAVVVREVSEIVRTLAAQKRIRIRTEIDGALGRIMADARSLKQILYNYISNALKFTPDEGKVVVRVKAESKDTFRIEVEDSGVGISAEDIGRLFFEFQQLDGSASKKYSGTGLGLALTKRIVEAQGGRVGVSSTPGVGSIFYAILPRLTEPVGETAKEETHVATSHRSPLILVIEDDAKDRTWIARELSEAGYQVETVATGSEALVRCRERRYDAITIDMMLPDMTGRAVLGKIRERGLNVETPVVVMTVLAHKGIAVGFKVSHILAKPVAKEELLDALRCCGIEPGSPILDPQSST
jgi:PAS domain S-box-containing protein